MNPPEDFENYELGEKEVKMFHPRYDASTGKFQSLSETLGYIMVCGDTDEHFLDYGLSKQNSKVLHSVHKKRMPSSFSGTFFNRDGMQYKSESLQTNHSHIYFFLPSTTDRIEEINRHMGSVNLLPIDISEDSFEVEGSIQFDPSKLDYENPEKEKMSEAVVKMLRKVKELSNTNLVKNADRILAKMSVDDNIEWVGKEKKRLPDNRYKMSY